MNKIDYELRKKCGVYSIKNVINNKEYIGSSKNLYNRLHEHLNNLKYNKGHNSHLQNAWNKYGENNFVYKIISFCDIQEQFDKEQYYLDLYNPEYNFAAKVIAFTNRTVPEEERKRISETLKRRYKNKEIKVQRSLHMSKNCYIYNVNNLKLVGESDCLELAMKMIGRSSSRTYKEAISRLFLNKYIISINKFELKIDLINYIYKNFFKLFNAKKIYLITEKENGELIYHKNKKNCAIFNNVSIPCIDKHLLASIENPFLPKKNNNKVYFSNIFYPIKGKAVPIEKSLELLESNIGKKLFIENPEINPEITKGSGSSYSVEGE